MSRSAELQTFIDATREAFATASVSYAERRLADQIFNGLEEPAEPGSPQPAQVPVCEHLAPALERAREHGGPTEALADALCNIASNLVWARRPSEHDTDPAFNARHANATVIGKDGLEIRNDIWIGISLLAPHTQYPNHRHPPEEIYLVMSPGEWRQEAKSWHSPGIGRVVHNTANIIHSMRSKTVPLLAVWCLWVE